MTPRQIDRSDDDSNWEDDDFVIRDFEEDLTDDDEEPTVPCPHCRREILEDLPRCPYCERYISQEDAPSKPKSWLIVIGVVLCLYVVYRWIAG
jgi:hypothetical protein